MNRRTWLTAMLTWMIYPWKRTGIELEACGVDHDGTIKMLDKLNYPKVNASLWDTIDKIMAMHVRQTGLCDRLYFMRRDSDAKPL